MAFLSIPILFLVGLFFVNSPYRGAVLVMGAFLYGVLIVTVPPIPMGVLIYPADLVFSLLFAIAVLRYVLGAAEAKGMRWVPIALFALFFISLVRGISQYGLKEACNASRECFYYLSGVLYFTSFGMSSRVQRKLMTVWMATSLIIVGIAIFRWIATAAGLGIASQWEGVGVSAIRVLNAEQALFLAVAFFASVTMSMSKTGPQWQRRAFYLMGPVILLLQHRTVWAAMVAGLLWLGLKDVRFRKQAIMAFAGMVVVGILLGAFVFGHQSGVVSDSMQDSATNGGTSIWRVMGWYQLLFNNPAMNLFNGTIGEPFGTGFNRIILGGVVDVSPHNWYVQAFLQLGIIGLLLQIGLYMYGMRRMERIPVRLSRSIYPDARFWVLILLLQLVFFFAYSATYTMAILTGLAIAGIRPRPRRPAPALLSAPVPPYAPA